MQYRFLLAFLLTLSASTASLADAPKDKASAPAAEKTAPAADAKPAAAAVTPAKPAPDPAAMREEAFQRGKRAYDRGDWVKAITDLRPLAEYGDVRAQLLLGNMYAGGNGVEQDASEAFALYHRAALANNTDGMVAVAAMYQTGQGISLNTQLAIGWFERAARLGSQAGAFFYGIHMFQGSKGTTYDIKPDHAAAYRWFRIAATHGGDKKLRHAAFSTAEQLETRLPPDQVMQADKDAKDWAPDTLDDIGPNPEEKLMQENAQKDKDKSAAPDANAPEKKPEEKKADAPMPEGQKPTGEPAKKDDAKPEDKKP